MSDVVRGRSLQLYFINGRPDGMLTAEMDNWDGHVLLAPYTQINDALGRGEAAHTGVYILLGEWEGESCAYIGEANNIGSRIGSHLRDAQMSWWDNTAALVTTANNRLNETHVRYLEGRLIEKARAVGRIRLHNKTNPSRNLSEADKDNMEVFLGHLLMILPPLGIDMFLDNRRQDRPAVDLGRQERSPVFELVARDLDLMATAVLEGGKFVVRKGSQARLQWAGNDHTHTYAKEHANLVRMRTLRQEGERCVFTMNWAFTKPSAAASVVLGTPVSGPVTWRVRGREQTYREWQAEQLSPSNDIEPTKKGEIVSLEERVEKLEEKVKVLEQAINDGTVAKGRSFEDLDRRVRENSDEIDKLKKNR